MYKILLVEDDSTVAYGLEFTLKSEGFQVTIADRLDKAKNEFYKASFDLILLDVKLPDGTGYEFCKKIRESSDIPIVFLTACDEEVNIVLGLDMGGDDYITKPFRIRELISRVKAVLRRQTKTIESSEVVITGGIKIHLLQGKVTKGVQEVVLTSLEYKLLLTLVKHPGQVLSRSTILENLWDVGGEFVDDNTLSVYIRRLREKLEDNPAEPKYILTVRGMGYKWKEGDRNEFTS
ncbi:response regulator transcription factor [Clostridium swellfunianum]|uniref:response regulator transcription factor n=1 Tax=Clostridium swellfunianum TaxID=1367462 RepID=UPI00202E5837|nr:response regulator transcription factor [Clostridium swellfunianum]MCM0649172.1 response regulator transcription factor [Clostridium swellfunianum]